MEDVEGWLIHDQSVDNLFIRTFFAESSKKSVPNYQNATIILVEAVDVGSVMDSMMLGSVKNKFEWPQSLHRFGVYPKLVEQIELLMCDEVCGGNCKSEG
jgi:hypothetical protein